MQDRLSAWLVEHGLVHRSLGFNYQGVETLQIEPEEWNSIVVISYVYGYNHLRSRCAYNVAPGRLLDSVYQLTRIEYGVDQPEEVCIKLFRISKNGNLMICWEYDNHPRLKHILMSESWIR
ncbi:hypothetical protein MKW92_010977 [Papaver armeniacum]|nr:hypothetical protein MKW92_010977 [Papaver armeniacum]